MTTEHPTHTPAQIDAALAEFDGTGWVDEDAFPGNTAALREVLTRALAAWRLIAAAPDLLAALKYVMTAHAEQIHDACEMAHRAIKKAEAGGVRHAVGPGLHSHDRNNTRSGGEHE